MFTCENPTAWHQPAARHDTFSNAPVALVGVGCPGGERVRSGWRSGHQLIPSHAAAIVTSSELALFDPAGLGLA